MKTAWTSDDGALDVRPTLIAARSLRAQIELVRERLGADADASDDVLEEWLLRLGYADAAARARLERTAAQADRLDCWHAATLRAVLLQPQALRFHCPGDATERPRVEWIAAQFRQRYPLRQAELVEGQ
jgi:hypothetical protein